MEKVQVEKEIRMHFINKYLATADLKRLVTRLCISYYH